MNNKQLNLKVMKKLVLFLTVSFLTTTTLFSQNKFVLVDSTTLFGKVDSLKQDEHTEFALSVFNVVCKNDEELTLVVNSLGNKFFPEGYVLYWANKTYYPKTEYVNDETERKLNKTYVYLEKTGPETTVYVLSPSGEMVR